MKHALDRIFVSHYSAFHVWVSYTNGRYRTQLRVGLFNLLCDVSYSVCAATPVKKLVQQFLFPHGIIYDFETGFGTIENIDFHLLINKIGGKSAENINLVGMTLTRWNTIKRELITLWEIFQSVKSYSQGSI